MIFFWAHRNEQPWSLNAMYRSIGISKQGFHKHLARYRAYQDEKFQLLRIISQIREDHPTMCCRSMYYRIGPTTMGRDRFELLCKQYGFTATAKKNGRRTTNSNGVKRFDNRLKNKILTHINQAWSSDITYYEVNEQFYYLTFVMDCYSRRILGHHVSARLKTEQTSLPALTKALKTRDYQLPPGIVFHSDGGGQYYEKKFLELTNKYHFENSMCEYAYENGKAERLNGVIKNCYLKHWKIQSFRKLVKSVDRAVNLYNREKPHKSLGLLSPVQFEENLFNLKAHFPELSTPVNLNLVNLVESNSCKTVNLI